MNRLQKFIMEGNKGDIQGGNLHGELGREEPGLQVEKVLEEAPGS